MAIEYGEPTELKGRHIYFTSWKYVRPGQFRWVVARQPGTTQTEQFAGGFLQGDGDEPARFETIDMPKGVRLVAQEAEKLPFGPGQLAAQVYDEGKYKCWYGIPPCPDPEPFSTKEQILPGQNHHVCYAESDDGFNWRKPELGLYEYAGSRTNNIVFRGDLDGSIRGFHGGSVFIDPSSTEERYKMLYLGMITDAEWDAFAQRYPGEVDPMARRRNIGPWRCVMAVCGAVSPDGLHWTALPEPLAIQHSDTQNTCYYDVDRKLYVAYLRTWQVNEKSADAAGLGPDNWIGVGRRAIGRAVSADFRHFSKPEHVIAPGADLPPSHVWYTNGKTTLPDAPDNHVMFPWLWETERDGGDVRLFSSPDGWVWSQVPGGPVLKSGPAGQGDGGFVTCGVNLLEYPGERWGIPYSGHAIPHKYPGRNLAKRTGLFPGVRDVSGLAVWPKGRLAALEAAEEGEFATVAVMPKGRRIRLNAVVPPTGYVKVGVRLLGQGDVPGRTCAESDRVIGDSLAHRVTWRGEAELGHNGAPVVLKFQMRQAKLFAIEFCD